MLPAKTFFERQGGRELREGAGNSERRAGNSEDRGGTLKTERGTRCGKKGREKCRDFQVGKSGGDFCDGGKRNTPD